MKFSGAGIVARNGALSMAALAVLGGTRVVYGSLISHAVDRETYGIVGALTALTLISSFVLPAGLASAITRFVPFSRGEGDDAAARGIYRTLSRAGLGGAALLSLVAALIAWQMMGRPPSQVAEVGLLTFAYSLYTTWKAALYAFGRVRRYVVIEIVGSAVTLAATVLILIVGVTWFLLPFVAGYAVFVVAAWQAVRSDRRGSVKKVSRPLRREAILYTTLACAGTVASAGFLQATQLLAATLAAPGQLAYFAAAVTLVTPMYFLPRALALALFPFLSEAHGAGNVARIQRHTDVGTRALIGIVTPAFVVVQLLGIEVMVAFGGPEYAGGAAVFQTLLTASYLGILQVPAVNALSSGSGLQLRTPVGWAVAGCLLGLLVIGIIGAPLGAAGVGIGYLAGTSITAAGPIAVVWRRYRMPWTGSFVRSLSVVAGAFLIARLLDTPDAHEPVQWARDGALAILGGAVAIIASRDDIVSVIQLARGRITDEEADPMSADAPTGCATR